MAIISDKFKLIFIMNPRTGCTAMGNLLRNKLGGYYVPEEDIINDKNQIMIQKKHTTVSELENHLLIDNYKLTKYLKFTTVRNPFDSLVSAWVKKKYKYSSEAVRNDPNHFVNMVPGYNEDIDFIQDHTFSEWILEKFDSNKPRTINFKYVKGTDRYLRFESLQNEFSSMLNELGIENELVIPVVNVTKNKENDYRQYYTNEARKAVAEAFRKELEYFNYSF